MSIWNKVLVGCIGLVSVVFFYMAARTLKTHEHWREKAQRHQEKIDKLERENRVLAEGEGAGENAVLGIAGLQLELHKALIDRGRVWYNCTPEQVNPQTGQAAVTTDLPDPHGIGDQTVLYVFEEADVTEGGSFLGEFKVTAVDQKQVALEPSIKLDAQKLKRLAERKGPWTLYEILPADNHDAFADLDEEELKNLLPQTSAAEYVHNGQPATQDDLDNWGVTGKIEDGQYVRQLRDYEVLFEDYDLQRSIVFDLYEAKRRDTEAIQAAKNDAQLQREFREAEKVRLRADQVKYTRERDAVAAHQRALQAVLDKVNQSIAKMLQSNKDYARKIAKSQLDATRHIDARIRKMAQANAEAN